ncbi:MAG: DUF2786 domain-containing protein [Gammaproteobacteria bacterium]|nr:DUF2786 domain-containing protein [Gammaproteobacteria bacterium]
MTNQEKIIDRIEKLLRLSKSDNQHEAELAAQRANKLMTKHQISVSALDVDNMRNAKIEQIVYQGDTIRRQWVSVLANACAILFDGKVVLGRRSNTIYFVGFEEDNQAGQQLFTHLYDSWFGIVKRDAKAAKTERKEHGTRFSGAAFRNAHGIGYAYAIHNRVLDLIEERKAEVAAVSQTGTDLIVVKSKALEDYEKSQNWCSSRSSLSSGDEEGYGAGNSAGANAALGGAIS